MNRVYVENQATPSYERCLKSIDPSTFYLMSISMQKVHVVGDLGYVLKYV